MLLKSSAFQNGKEIPSVYTCDEKDISPPLAWEGAPQETKSFALIADDPDAPMGTWVHWVLYDLPPDTKNLPENMPKSGELESGAKQGITDFKRVGYGGPCPPSGTHRYFFKLYALDTVLNQKSGLSKKDVLQLIKGHILAEAVLMGTYAR